jgi:DnaJ family protein A protein 5
LAGNIDSDTSQTTEEPVDDLAQKLSATLFSNATNPTMHKIGKAKQKRDKKAAQKASGEQSEFICTACQARFSSKTRLFSHIKELGHVQPVWKPAKPAGKSRKR